MRGGGNEEEVVVDVVARASSGFGGVVEKQRVVCEKKGWFVWLRLACRHCKAGLKLSRGVDMAQLLHLYLVENAFKVKKMVNTS